MKSKLLKQLYVITKSYITRLNNIGLFFVILLIPAFINSLCKFTEDISMVVHTTSQQEIHESRSAAQLSYLFTSFFYVTYYPGLTYIYIKYRYLSLSRTYLFPNYPKAIHWLTGLIYLTLSVSLFYWCRYTGIDFVRAFSIIFIALTYVFLFTATDHAFYSTHTNRFLVFWCLIPFPQIFIFFPDLTLKVIPYIQWYLFEDHYYYLPFFVTGTFAYLYNSIRINHYYQRMTELGIESAKYAQGDAKTEVKNRKYREIDQKWFSLDRLFEQDFPDCSTLNKSGNKERIRLWRAGNENLTPTKLWSIIIFLTLGFFYLTTMKNRISINLLVFYSLAMMLYIPFLSQHRIQSWSDRIDINPAEILKPVERQIIIHDYFYGILRDQIRILLFFIFTCLALLTVFQHDDNCYYFLLFSFSSIFYLQSVLCWIDSQSRKETKLVDYGTIILPAIVIITVAMAALLSFQEFFNPAYYLAISMILSLLGLSHYSTAYKHWQNMEWGAKG